MGDVEELRFVINSYKLDSANEHFLKVTGLFDLPMDRDKVTKYLKELNLHYTLREINKGLYSYCAEGVEEFRFCYSEEKCNDCGINDICEKNL